MRAGQNVRLESVSGSLALEPRTRPLLGNTSSCRALPCPSGDNRAGAVRRPVGLLARLPAEGQRGARGARATFGAAPALASLSNTPHSPPGLLESSRRGHPVIRTHRWTPDVDGSDSVLASTRGVVVASTVKGSSALAGFTSGGLYLAHSRTCRF